MSGFVNSFSMMRFVMLAGIVLALAGLAATAVPQVDGDLARGVAGGGMLLAGIGAWFGMLGEGR